VLILCFLNFLKEVTFGQVAVFAIFCQVSLNLILLSILFPVKLALLHGIYILAFAFYLGYKIVQSRAATA
jgi:hypothetical protein